MFSTKKLTSDVVSVQTENKCYLEKNILFLIVGLISLTSNLHERTSNEIATFYDSEISQNAASKLCAFHSEERSNAAVGCYINISLYFTLLSLNRFCANACRVSCIKIYSDLLHGRYSVLRYYATE